MVLTQIFACFALTGLIWAVQLVHYPAFRFVDPARFPAFSVFHANRITWIVAPLMLADLASAGVLCFTPGGAPLAWNLGAALAIWASTFLLSVPCHARLQGGAEAATIERLVRTNWVRTILWSARTALLLTLLARGKLCPC